MKHWTDGKPHTWDNRRDGKALDDWQVADKVRMLMRDDWDHEAVCTLARDRIASLARWHDRILGLMERIALGEIADPKTEANRLLNQITAERSGVWMTWPPSVRPLEQVLDDAEGETP